MGHAGDGGGQRGRRDGVVFHFAVEIATHQRMEHPWLLLLLPLGGVAIALLYQKTGMEKDMGTNTILEAVRGEQPLRLRTAPLSFYQHRPDPSVGRFLRQRRRSFADWRQFGC